MGERFRRVKGDRYVVTLSEGERQFLADVTLMLKSVDSTNHHDAASTRLKLPVYLDDAESTDEWWRLMGDQLDTLRGIDRRIFDRVMDGDDEVVLSADEAESLLRVINEGRLVLAARLGVRVASDFEDMDDEQRLALDFLHWLLEDLTSELSRRL